MSDERRTQEVHASHDGELSRWRRFLLRRRLARDPAARRELETLGEIGELMREGAGEAAAPDLWPGIAARLPYAEVPSRATRASTSPLGGVPGWAGAGLATAAIALALVFFVGTGGGDGGPLPGSVQWLDSGGRTTIVLQDDAEATIIWVLPETARTPPSDGRIEHARV